MQSDAERQDFFPVSIEGDDPNDDTCGICGDGGNLICCDGCPSTFHMSCLGLEALPTDYWCCSNCSCKFCHEHSSDDAEDTADVDSSLHTCSQCEEQCTDPCLYLLCSSFEFRNLLTLFIPFSLLSYYIILMFNHVFEYFIR
ncbi:Acyl-CoA N-acyltransferase with RING/FYVE/PHD-type zinc finger protein [Zea mays]|nr:Acyl-CoA N-acyltransferase with RING/FYVE/PHD-type zinc finger protein [Zea mays]